MRLQQLALPLSAEPFTATPAPAPLAAAVAFVRRKGTRRYILRVLDDGTLRVTVPWWGRKAEALRFVESQADWIARQRAKRAAVDRTWRAGKTVLVDGDLRTIDVRPDGARHAVHVGDARAGIVAAADADARTTVEAWLRARAKATLPAELQALAARHAIAVSGVAIRNQRSRWGSCARGGAISLNWRLVQVPPAVREYVLVHELMHCRQMNHSARFWRLVAAACPDYLAARKWLRVEGAALF